MRRREIGMQIDPIIESVYGIITDTGVCTTAWEKSKRVGLFFCFEYCLLSMIKSWPRWFSLLLTPIKRFTHALDSLSFLTPGALDEPPPSWLPPPPPHRVIEIVHQNYSPPPKYRYIHPILFVVVVFFILFISGTSHRHRRRVTQVRQAHITIEV